MLGEARGGNAGLARELVAVFGYSLTWMKQGKKLSHVSIYLYFCLI